MSDLISRQDAIDAVTRAIWHYPNECYKNLNVYEVAEALASDAIKSLPSAEPKTGKWEIKTETDEYGLKRPKLVCSKCEKEPVAWDLTELFEFCPNCGARMNGGEKE